MDLSMLDMRCPLPGPRRRRDNKKRKAGGKQQNDWVRTSLSNPRSAAHPTCSARLAQKWFGSPRGTYTVFVKCASRYCSAGKKKRGCGALLVSSPLSRTIAAEKIGSDWGIGGGFQTTTGQLDVALSNGNVGGLCRQNHHTPMLQSDPPSAAAKDGHSAAAAPHRTRPKAATSSQTGELHNAYWARWIAGPGWLAGLGFKVRANAGLPELAGPKARVVALVSTFFARSLTRVSLATIQPISGTGCPLRIQATYRVQLGLPG